MKTPFKPLDLAKTETIIIRVTKKMKDDLIKLAKESRRELSDYVRLIIEDRINLDVKPKK